MFKDRSHLGNSVAGERVVISKISERLFALMKHLAAEAFTESLHYDYKTDYLVAVARSWKIACPVISDRVWGGINDPAYLRRATEVLLPRLR